MGPLVKFNSLKPTILPLDLQLQLKLLASPLLNLPPALHQLPPVKSTTISPMVIILSARLLRPRLRHLPLPPALHQLPPVKSISLTSTNLPLILDICSKMMPNSFFRASFPCLLIGERQSAVSGFWPIATLFF